MTYLKRAQKELHISDTALNRIMDVLDEVRETIDSGGEYTPQAFERKVLEIIPCDPTDPTGPRYDYHMVQDIAAAFLYDDRYTNEVIALYMDDSGMKSTIESWKEKKLREIL